MGYVKVGWKETVAITAARLNAMETQYDEFYSDFEAHHHDDRYDTKAGMDDLFFHAGNDGPGSEMDAATVDGYSASQIVAAAFPGKGICAWSGEVGSIPAGFVLCNGANGTPDLRGRFLVNVGTGYARGATGGFATRTPSASLVIASHILTTAQLPVHDHEYTDYYASGSTGWLCMTPSYAADRDNTSRNATTTNAGGGLGHGHPGSTFTGVIYDNRPAWFALCFIMKEVIA